MTNGSEPASATGPVGDSADNRGDDADDDADDELLGDVDVDALIESGNLPPLEELTSLPANCGGLIRRVRRRSDLSQRQLAERVGMSATHIAQLESGAKRPSLEAFSRILAVAGFRLVVCDQEQRLVIPLVVWRDVADRAGRRYPAHLDTILDPRFGEWWADVYGLTRPPETFRRSKAWREWQREQSRWEVRVKQLRRVPPPRRPRREPEWERDA